MWMYYLLFITGPVALLIALAGTALLGVAGHSMKRAFGSFFVAVALMLLFPEQSDFIFDLLPAVKYPTWKG